MEPIRIATPEEIEAIKAHADLTANSTVLAFGKDLAVVRQVSEIDPLFFANDSNPKRRLLFMWGLENMLRMVGVPEYYFNLHADDPKYLATMQETFGAKPTSTAPEIRFKKSLL
jgi:hypothetical protein